jgi:hypothetical protein
MFKQFEEMQKGNPQEILNQIIKPEQKEQFIKYAKGFGISEEQINKVLTR